MGAIGTISFFSAGVVVGVFLAQQYSIPDVRQGMDWLVSLT